MDKYFTLRIQDEKVEFVKELLSYLPFVDMAEVKQECQNIKDSDFATKPKRGRKPKHNVTSTPDYLQLRSIMESIDDLRSLGY